LARALSRPPHARDARRRGRVRSAPDRARMRFLVAALAVLALTGCGASSSAAPKGDPRQAALKVLDQIVHNRYTEAWDDLHPTDQAVAPRAEYVGCESRSPVIATPRSVRVVGVKDESIGLGDG